MVTPRPLVLVSDDADDQTPLRAAAAERGVAVTEQTLTGATALGRYLRQEGEFSRTSPGPAPILVLVDMDKPLATLRAVRRDTHTRRLPVVILVREDRPEAIQELWAEGASSVILRPQHMEDWVELMGLMDRYWLGWVTLP